MIRDRRSVFPHLCIPTGLQDGGGRSAHSNNAPSAVPAVLPFDPNPPGWESGVRRPGSPDHVSLERTPESRSVTESIRQGDHAPLSICK